MIKNKSMNLIVGFFVIASLVILWGPALATGNDSHTHTDAEANAEGGDSNASITGIRQVPSMGAPGIYSSHPCVIGKSAVLAVKNVGIGGGGQKVDVDCADREWSRIMFALGMLDQARELACLSPSGQKLKSCDYLDPGYDVNISIDSNMLMADVTQEEYETQQKLIEDKFTQFELLIQAQQEEIKVQREEIASHSDDEDLEYLKMLAAEQRAAEQKRLDADVARRAATRAILAKKKEAE